MKREEFQEILELRIRRYLEKIFNIHDDFYFSFKDNNLYDNEIIINYELKEISEENYLFIIYDDYDSRYSDNENYNILYSQFYNDDEEYFKFFIENIKNFISNLIIYNYNLEN